jgi:molybdopterin converting factor small subunit
MAVVIEIPEELGRYAGGQAEVEVDGSTVEAALVALFDRFPELRSRVVGSQGEFHAWTPVFLNGAKLASRGAASTAVADGDRIEVVVLASGG